MINLSVPIVPRSPGQVLRVLMIGRVSTLHQDVGNIEASYEDAKGYLSELYSGEIQAEFVGDQVSGWKVLRSSMVQALEDIAAHKYDLVIMEDIGRAYRNPEFQYRLAFLCKDSKTRLICPGDGIDTEDPNWESNLNAAVSRHAMTVPETRRRVKRTATSSFNKGGMVLKIRAGYVRVSKEDAAKATGSMKGVRIAKDPAFTEVIREIRVRILRGDKYSQIAEWLNDEGIKPGPYASRGEWSSQLVIDLMRDSILQGERSFRKFNHQLVYRTGEHRREKNPEPLKSLCPELAHLTRDEQISLWVVMDERRKRRRQHCRTGVARKDSYVPGQLLICGICGDELYWISKTKLKCRNAIPGKPRRCWCQVLIDGPELRRQLVTALLTHCRQSPELFERLCSSAWDEYERTTKRASGQVAKLQAELRDVARVIDRVAGLLVKSESDALLNQLNTHERKAKELKRRLAEEQQKANAETTYLDRAQFVAEIDEVVMSLASTSYRFSAVIRSLVKELRVIPVQALDSAQVHARFRMTLPPLLEGGEPVVTILEPFRLPKHIQYVEQCARLKTENPDLTLMQIGQRVGIGKQRVHKALKYAELMRLLGTTDRFVELTTRPVKASRWRRQSLASAG